jgi:hypothetical protein
VHHFILYISNGWLPFRDVKVEWIWLFIDVKICFAWSYNCYIVWNVLDIEISSQLLPDHTYRYDGPISSTLCHRSSVLPFKKQATFSSVINTQETTQMKISLMCQTLPSLFIQVGKWLLTWLTFRRYPVQMLIGTGYPEFWMRFILNFLKSLQAYARTVPSFHITPN